MPAAGPINEAALSRPPAGPMRRGMSKDSAHRVVALADTTGGTIADRRRSPRRPACLRGRLTYPLTHPLAGPLAAAPDGGTATTDMTVADLSHHGMGLI